jgi:Barrier to autointegration factor
MSAAAAKPFRIDATSLLSDTKLSAFVNATLEQDLSSVPNVGPESKQKLMAFGIENVYQLIGQFLCCKKTGFNSQQHCDAFMAVLTEAGAEGARAAIRRDSHAACLNPPSSPQAPQRPTCRPLSTA